MTKNEAIKNLEDLVSRIPDLQHRTRSSEEFEKWHHDVRTVLKHVFPNEPGYAYEFANIPFFLMVSDLGTTEREYQAAFRADLNSARAMLQSRIDEVREFWSGDRASNELPITPTNPELVFVIHGRQLLADFHDFLRALGLKPLEWSQARTRTGKPNPYTWEIVDTALRTAGAIVALLTPDDEARLRKELWSRDENALEKEYLHQPRQNVLFEAGAAYGRAPQRTVLIRVGSHRPMSDLAGHHILKLDNSAESRQAVADALRTAGCPVDVSGADWFRAGDFSKS